ncbi:hypothetical protein RHGRI_005424 [Rhododendron griersonianum]|uniref:Uncharacterized protein n=1 Tax=Rhododendron griersonianum TaxID=479676 RepID=A0AAV6LC95_9ERIC|nr:hypothetical protein RHGRI_005424 [Rhododendron griersonianum]
MCALWYSNLRTDCAIGLVSTRASRSLGKEIFLFFLDFKQVGLNAISGNPLALPEL